MFDKIRIRLNRERLPVLYDWRSVLDSTGLICYYANGSGGCGMWRRCKVRAGKGYVEFEGSLPKCLYGHNCNTRPITLVEVEKVIGDLSRELGVPMEDADVMELEFAHNFSMDRNPSLYTDRIQGIGGFADWNIYGTKYIEKEKRVRLKFYDKCEDAKKKREQPRNGEASANLLRYEMTLYRKEIVRMFGGLSAGDLYSKKTYWCLVSEWLYYFGRIECKRDVIGVDFGDLGNPKGFVRWIVGNVDAEQDLVTLVKEMFDSRLAPNSKDRQVHKNIKDFLFEIVRLKYTIDVDGSVIDVKIDKGVDSSIDNEAVRVLSSSPKWTPGYLFGRPVKVTYNFPVYFQLR